VISGSRHVVANMIVIEGTSRGMLKTWVGYSAGQDFINIF